MMKSNSSFLNQHIKQSKFINYIAMSSNSELFFIQRKRPVSESSSASSEAAVAVISKPAKVELVTSGRCSN